MQLEFYGKFYVVINDQTCSKFWEIIDFLKKDLLKKIYY